MSNWVGIWVMAFCVWSCNIQEELYVNEDGSGEYNYTIVFNSNQFFNDNFQWKDTDSTKIMSRKDTVIYGKDLYKAVDQNPQFKDSLELKKSLSKLVGYQFRNYSNEEENENKVEISTRFSSLENLIDGYEALNYMSLADDIMSQKNTYTFNDYDNNMGSRMTFTSREFSRVFKPFSFDPIKHKNIDKNLIENFGKLFTVKTIYYFPYPVSSTDLKEATFSLDRKIMYSQIGLGELFIYPKKNSFVVKFQHK